jgi:hypothetical protein
MALLGIPMAGINAHVFPPQSSIFRKRRRGRPLCERGKKKGGHVSLESHIVNAHGAHPERMFPPRLITTMIFKLSNAHHQQGEIPNWSTHPGAGLNSPFYLLCLSRRGPSLLFPCWDDDLHSRRYGSSFQDRTYLLLTEDGPPSEGRLGTSFEGWG